MAEEPVKTTETAATAESKPVPQGNTRSTESSTAPQGNTRPAGAREGGARRSDTRRPPARRPRYPRSRKFCKFCADTSIQIDHKNPDMLKQFITDRYKILPSRVTGTCAKHQRALTTAVKRARNLALIPFTPLHHD